MVEERRYCIDIVTEVAAVRPRCGRWRGGSPRPHWSLRRKLSAAAARVSSGPKLRNSWRCCLVQTDDGVFARATRERFLVLRFYTDERPLSAPGSCIKIASVGRRPGILHAAGRCCSCRPQTCHCQPSRRGQLPPASRRATNAQIARNSDGCSLIAFAGTFRHTLRSWKLLLPGSVLLYDVGPLLPQQFAGF